MKVIILTLTLIVMIIIHWDKFPTLIQDGIKTTYIVFKEISVKGVEPPEKIKEFLDEKKKKEN